MSELSRTVSLYDPATGLFVGQTLTAPEQYISQNVPDGLKAMDGQHDHLSRKIDLATGEVVDHTPPPDSPEVLAAAAARVARSEIRSLEFLQHRALRELLLDPGMVALLGPQSATALAKLRDLETQIEAARKSLVSASTAA